jgi:hypothetical protein
VELPLQRLFERPTVAEMARLIEASHQGPAASEGSIRPRPRGATSLEQLLANVEDLSADDLREQLGMPGGRGGEEEA